MRSSGRGVSPDCNSLIIHKLIQLGPPAQKLLPLPSRTSWRHEKAYGRESGDTTKEEAHAEVVAQYQGSYADRVDDRGGDHWYLGRHRDSQLPSVPDEVAAVRSQDQSGCDQNV